MAGYVERHAPTSSFEAVVCCLAPHKCRSVLQASARTVSISPLRSALLEYIGYELVGRLVRGPFVLLDC